MKLSAPLKATVVLAVSLLMTTNIYAQGLAKLTGKVTDKESGEELIGASVSVVSTKTGASTNVDGIYTISVQPGTYDLRASYVGYQTQVFKNVEVKAEGVSKYNIELKAETITQEEIVVEATQSTATEGALLTQQRKSTTVQDAISAELIKRTPDSDAGEAAKRITGVSVVGGKFVFVRGLGERYSSTQLNGVTIPSPEPEKKVVPFDIIPASLIENITTIKTFQPDQPGTFGGGLVKIKTKEFPDEFQLNAGVGSGFNTNAHFNTRIGYQGGRTDWLGFDDGIRNLPAGFPVGSQFSTRGSPSDRQNALNALGSLSQGIAFPRPANFGPNQSYSLSLADQLNLGRIPLGYIASLTYGSDAAYKEQTLFFPGSTQQAQDIIYNYTQRVATYNVNWGGLLNFSSRLGDNNKLGWKTTYNRAAEDETIVSEGIQPFELQGADLRNSRLRYLEREILSTQLTGTHYVSALAKSEIEWKLQYATAKRNEPDNRQTRYQKLTGEPDSAYFVYLQGLRNFRFYSDLLDVERDVLLDWKIPFRQWSGLNANIKFGGLYTSKNRRFSANRYVFREGTEFFFEPVAPDVLFTKEFVENNLNRIAFEDGTSSTDNYDAREDLLAGYIMTELPLTSQLRFIGGVRIERDTVRVSSTKFRSTDPDILNGGFNVTNVLPAATLIYSLNEAINVRASYSRTVAQPEYRELAAFRFDDVLSSTVGNPTLTQTTITNFDVRWEWYPRLGELISISGFYKILDNPIEKIVFTAGGNPLYTSANLSNSVNNIGVEFEVRKKLDFIAPTTPIVKDVSVSLNVTLISSNLTPRDSVAFYNVSQGTFFQPYGSRIGAKARPLQGQSPFVVNANLGYSNEELGLSAIILYNIVGRRILALSERPDTFGDFYEESRNQLDISLTKNIWRKLQAKFSVRNILDDRYKTTVVDLQGIEQNAEFYRTGRSFSIGFSYSL